MEYYDPPFQDLAKEDNLSLHIAAVCLRWQWTGKNAIFWLFINSPSASDDLSSTYNPRKQFGPRSASTEFRETIWSI